MYQKLTRLKDKMIKRKYRLDDEDSDDSYSSVNEDLREIYVIGTITEEMSCGVISAIRQLDATRGAITFIINSGGGEVDAGFAIYDAISITKNKTVAYCFGMCQSMATILLQACDKRYLSPNCRFMVHNGSLGVECSFDEAMALSKEYKLQNVISQQILAKRATISLAKIKKLCYSTTYMSAEECCQAGFADGILEIPRRRR
jgi:ATP-dependent Clp protease protease subunit